MGIRLTDSLPAPRTITQGSGGPITKETAEKEQAVLLDLRPHVSRPFEEALHVYRDEHEAERPTVESSKEVEQAGRLDVHEVVPEADTHPAAVKPQQKRKKYSDWMNPAVKDDRKIDPVAVRNMVAGLDTRTKLYTLREAAVVLRHSPITLREWIKAGKLKARKMGGQWFVSGYELSRQIGEVGHGKRRVAR